MKSKVHKYSVGDNSSKEIATALIDFLHAFNKYKRKNKKTGEPIFLCVGTDGLILDTLGPLCGTLIKQKSPKAHVYGCLGSLQTAKNIMKTWRRLKKDYLDRPIIVIDAAATEKEGKLGFIELMNKPLKPGLGAGKNLGKVGDFSIIGITTLKAWLYTHARLSDVYMMAQVISEGVIMFLEEWKRNNKPITDKVE